MECRNFVFWLVDSQRLHSVLGELCPRGLCPYCTQAAEAISPKEAELAMLPLLLFPHPVLYAGPVNGLALSGRTKRAFTLGLWPAPCAGPPWGLALVLSAPRLVVHVGQWQLYQLESYFFTSRNKKLGNTNFNEKCKVEVFSLSF